MYRPHARSEETRWHLRRGIAKHTVSVDPLETAERSSDNFLLWTLIMIL